MNRTELDALITEWYGTEAEYPWPSAPTYAVYRHADNHKWFAVIMELPKEKTWSFRWKGERGKS